MFAFWMQSFNSDNVAFAYAGNWRLAGLDRFPVNMHSTRATLTDSAAVFCTDQIEMIPQHPQQRSISGNIHGFLLIVDVKGIFTHD
jgi:hypothetical protein